ncbi:MAG TPA: IS110 family transposase [Phycisphaerae bacterium]|nr:IS110 family transposase [Phycisphaerae bacterium]
MKILALDLGKNKSVYVDYLTGSQRQTFGKIGTNAHDVEQLLRRCSPDRLVIEAGPASGWVCDIAWRLNIPIQVANGNDERWRWKTVKAKTDRSDALKLAQLSEMNCLPTVHVPAAPVRQWRALIEYRHSLVRRQTAIKNSLRSIYERQGLHLGSVHGAWTKQGLARLKQDVSGASGEQIWLFQVGCELEQLERVQEQIHQVEGQLAKLGQTLEAVKRLQQAPCVGPRLSEAVVAVLDNPQRFKNGRQVGCYVGLTPRRWQSGQSDRQGHISKAGHRLLRGLLVEIAWLGVWKNTWMREVYEQVRRGSPKRKKIAIVAVARRLLVKLWAMLRDGTPWKNPTGLTVGIER